MSASEQFIDDLLASGADLNQLNSDGESPLVAACARGSLEVVRKLLRSGASSSSGNERQRSSKSRKSRSPLGIAVKRGNRAIVEELIHQGADVNERSVEYGTALQMACDKDMKYLDYDLIDLLLNHGADVNAPAAYKDELTALQFAASHGAIKLALILLDQGADVDAPCYPDEPPRCNAPKGTALEFAAAAGRLDMVKLLLNAHTAQGKPPNWQSAVKLAEEGGYFPIAEFLESQRKSAGTNWHSSESLRLQEDVELLPNISLGRSDWVAVTEAVDVFGSIEDWQCTEFV